MESLENKPVDPAVEALSAYAAEQRKYQKTQSVLALIRTAAAVLVLFVIAGAAVITLPRVNAALDEVTTVAGQINELDIETMMQSVTQLATSGSAGIESALEDVSKAISVIESLDIEGLNKSIEDLGAVMGPLAKLFGKK